MEKRNPHIGSNFDDFLSDEGLLAETAALAMARVIAYELDEARRAWTEQGDNGRADERQPCAT